MNHDTAFLSAGPAAIDGTPPTRPRCEPVNGGRAYSLRSAGDRKTAYVYTLEDPALMATIVHQTPGTAARVGVLVAHAPRLLDTLERQLARHEAQLPCDIAEIAEVVNAVREGMR